MELVTYWYHFIIEITNIQQLHLHSVELQTSNVPFIQTEPVGKR